MVAYPDVLTSVTILNPFTSENEFKTIVTTFDNLGNQTTKQKWLYPKRNVTLTYLTSGQSTFRTLWQFYNARAGKYGTFSFFYPYSDVYIGEYIGTGDGTTTTWNLPVKTGSSYTVYIDGSSVSGGGVDYTYTSGGGGDGEDLIAFTVAPNSGTRLTMDFTGILKIRANFADDILSWDNLLTRIFTTGIKLKGKLNA